MAARAALWFTPADDHAGLDAQAATEALAALPLDQREVIVAHLWGGLTFEQIAELTRGSGRFRLAAASRLVTAPNRALRGCDY